MAAPAPMSNNTPTLSGPVTMETPISLRISVQGATRKFKLPLGDLNAQVLPGKVCVLPFCELRCRCVCVEVVNELRWPLQSLLSLRSRQVEAASADGMRGDSKLLGHDGSIVQAF